MKVSSITEKYVTPKTTGYASAAGLGLAVLSGLSKNKAIRKTHKPFSYITAALTLLHIGLIEYYSYKYRHNSGK